MKPIRINFHNVTPSLAIETAVKERVDRLTKFYPRITSCQVMIEYPHRHHHKGALFRVHIDLSVPQEEIVINNVGPKNKAHSDVYVAIRDAFDAITRRLQEHAKRIRGEVKYHNLQAARQRRRPPIQTYAEPSIAMAESFY